MSQNWELAVYFFISHQVILQSRCVGGSALGHKTLGNLCPILGALHLDTPVKQWVDNQYSYISWLSLFNFLKRSHRLVAKVSWVLPIFGNREYLHGWFFPGVITAGLCSPTLIKCLLFSWRVHPFLSTNIKFNFRTVKIIREAGYLNHMVWTQEWLILSHLLYLGNEQGRGAKVRSVFLGRMVVSCC